MPNLVTQRVTKLRPSNFIYLTSNQTVVNLKQRPRDRIGGGATNPQAKPRISDNQHWMALFGGVTPGGSGFDVVILIRKFVVVLIAVFTPIIVTSPVIVERIVAHPRIEDDVARAVCRSGRGLGENTGVGDGDVVGFLHFEVPLVITTNGQVSIIRGCHRKATEKQPFFALIRIFIVLLM